MLVTGRTLISWLRNGCTFHFLLARWNVATRLPILQIDKTRTAQASLWRVFLSSIGLFRARVNFIAKSLHSQSLSRSWDCEDLRSLSLDWRGQKFLLPTFHPQIRLYCLRRKREGDHPQLHEKYLWCLCTNASSKNTRSDRSATLRKFSHNKPSSNSCLNQIKTTVSWLLLLLKTCSICAFVLDIWASSQEAKAITISNNIVRILGAYVARREGEGIDFDRQYHYITSRSACARLCNSFSAIIHMYAGICKRFLIK